MRRRRYALVAAVMAALVGVLAVGAWASARTPDRSGAPGYGPGMMDGYGAGATYGPDMMGGQYGPGMMGGGYWSGMMGGGYGLPGDGRRVVSLSAARQRAQAFADRLGGLRAGEVMQFAGNFYVELDTSDGHGATEVLVWPGNGAVSLEYGPAMMWNTRYGMHPYAAPASARVSAVEAKTAAQRWLDDQGGGLTAGEAEEFPGYYTLHTVQGGKVAGMLSVNAATGQVWYHTWHGAFVAMSEG